MGYAGQLAGRYSRAVYDAEGGFMQLDYYGGPGCKPDDANFAGAVGNMMQDHMYLLAGVEARPDFRCAFLHTSRNL